VRAFGQKPVEAFPRQLDRIRRRDADRGKAMRARLRRERDLDGVRIAQKSRSA